MDCQGLPLTLKICHVKASHRRVKVSQSVKVGVSQGQSKGWHKKMKIEKLWNKKYPKGEKAEKKRKWKQNITCEKSMERKIKITKK